MKTFTVLILGLAGLLALAAASFYIHTKETGVPLLAVTPQDGSTAPTNATSTPAALATSTPLTQEVARGARLYTDNAFHFSLEYPDNLVATDYKEQRGALTVTFQDPHTSEGFEVYVTPYSGTQITQAQFDLDEPSGTFLQPTNVVIDGTQATMFYGYNGLMGDTREVWFIHGGYLYEVATFKSLGTWLGQIMQTWSFIV